MTSDPGFGSAGGVSLSSVGQMNVDRRRDYENATGDENVDVRFGDGAGMVKLLIALVVVIGGLVLGIAFMLKSGDEAVQASSATKLAQPQAVSKGEAAEVAREAQEFSRQHMQRAQREVQAAEGRLAGAGQSKTQPE